MIFIVAVAVLAELSVILKGVAVDEWQIINFGHSG
jgi:hypothetical protein